MIFFSRRFRREVTAARRTYRLAAEDAIARADEAAARALARERKLDALLDALVVARVERNLMNYVTTRWGGARLTIVIECDDLLSRVPLGDEYERLAHRIVLQLAELPRIGPPALDGPADMREACTCGYPWDVARTNACAVHGSN